MNGPDLAMYEDRLEADRPPAEPPPWEEPEDRGAATAPELGGVEYVTNLLRPGRIVVVAAEEGTGKSYAFQGELGIRLAVAGGLFAGTWPVVQTGPVLVLSEMPEDEDYDREETILATLGLGREALAGRYYRLALATAAGGAPVLDVDAWRERVTAWLAEHQALALIIDTATNATDAEPWGAPIRKVLRNLRAMQATYPALAIVLVVHMKKPSGQGGERRLSDVMGEWGRFNDVTVLMENDGPSLDRVKITTRKRVRPERRIVARKEGGLLVEPQDIAAGGTTKVPLDDVVAAIAAQPAIDAKTLGERLNVSKDTATRYAMAAIAAGSVDRYRDGPRGTFQYVLADTHPPDTVM